MRNSSKFFMTIVCGMVLLAAPLRADLEVDKRTDKVVLKDGTEIECIVLMVTARGTLIVEQDPKDKEKTHERIIPADEIDHIDHGETDGEKAGFQTDKELAHKVIHGEGFRKVDKKKEKKDDEEKKPIANPTLVMGKNAKTISTQAQGTASTGKLTSNDLANAYLSRFPVLKSTAQSLIGSDRLPQLMDAAQKGDPLARKQVEGFLQLFLGADNSALTEKVQPPQTPQKIKQPKPDRPGRPQDKPAQPSAPAAKK